MHAEIITNTNDHAADSDVDDPKRELDMKDFRKSVIRLFLGTFFLLFIAWVAMKAMQYHGDYERMIADAQRFLRNNASIFREIHLPRACRPHQRGSADPFSLKTLHWRVFRALEPLKTAHCAVFRALDAPEPAASLPGEGFWMPHLPAKSKVT